MITAKKGCHDIVHSLLGFISATPSASDDAVGPIGTTILDTLTTTIPDSDIERLRSSAAIIQERISFCVSSYDDTLCNTNAPGAAPKPLLHINKDLTTSFITYKLINTPSPLPRYAALSYI
ncbi:hypothetical protein B0T18DRAFT_432886 [Schizothecium vesticola]|uniref:Uncharacterized protein n=1 Tax=Schizothecium vesticola TaxID=314040 RepID=A0AA40BPF9_9PEZI|nr:hypothetical protein B0T18DRAFT_432886 [Schizothecium vesticola]